MWIDPEDIDDLVQIGGLIRFSLPTMSGFQKNPVDRDEKLARLFAPSRMESRFRYFETLCLPSLKNQTDPNFTVGVLVGADMPRQYRERLETLLSDVPQARLIEKPLMDHKEAVAQAFNEVFDRETPIRFSFRFDDDDALAIDYIARVREKLPQLLLMSGGLDPKPVCLTFSQGLTLLGPPENRTFVAAHERSPIGIGLGVLAPAGMKPLVMNIPHMKIHMTMPTLLDPGPLMMLRTLHSNNDSKAKLLPSRRFEMTEAELRAALLDRFRLDLDEVLAL